MTAGHFSELPAQLLVALPRRKRAAVQLHYMMRDIQCLQQVAGGVTKSTPGKGKQRHSVRRVIQQCINAVESFGRCRHDKRFAPCNWLIVTYPYMLISNVDQISNAGSAMSGENPIHQKRISRDERKPQHAVTATSREAINGVQPASLGLRERKKRMRLQRILTAAR